MIHRIKTIDSHTAGEPLRLVIDGLPSPEGRTMLEKRTWATKHLDHLRKSIMLEPRGHTDMYGALLTEPVTRDGHAGILFMHNAGWSTMCGHGIIAVTTIALERGLMWSKYEGQPATVNLRYDTPAGRVEARAALTHFGDAVRVDSVAFQNVPSFVFEPSLLVTVGTRKIPVDIACGGAFYAIVDAEAVSDAHPYPGFCASIEPHYRQMIGWSMRPGFNATVRETFGGTKGCTHLTDLIGVLATTAYQNLAGQLPSNPDKKPFQLDGCHALANDAPAVATFYPKWYRGDAPTAQSEAGDETNP